jgi:mercuric ion transport protein
MNLPRALRSGGVAAAACTACCAPPIIAALGLTAGLAATVGIFLGLAAAVAVVLLGAGWIIRKRMSATTSACRSAPNSQPVSLTT